MILRSDHISGAAFVIFGIAIFALSGDLPFGTLSFPGSGFLPKILAVLLMIFGVTLFLRARESAPFVSIEWDDLRHALPVLGVAAVAIALYTVLGFLIAIFGLLFALLVLVERKPVLPAIVYSVAVTGLAYALFKAIKTPLPLGPLGF
jgi:hypothetical protein